MQRNFDGPQITVGQPVIEGVDDPGHPLRAGWAGAGGVNRLARRSAVWRSTAAQNPSVSPTGTARCPRSRQSPWRCGWPTPHRGHRIGAGAGRLSRFSPAPRPAPVRPPPCAVRLHQPLDRSGRACFADTSMNNSWFRRHAQACPAIEAHGWFQVAWSDEIGYRRRAPDDLLRRRLGGLARQSRAVTVMDTYCEHQHPPRPRRHGRRRGHPVPVSRARRWNSKSRNICIPATRPNRGRHIHLPCRRAQFVIYISP